MLYLDYGRNFEEFILDNEKKYPFFLKKILYFFRKYIGIGLDYFLPNGRRVVILSKINKRTYKKLDKIFKIDVIKNVCVCDELLNNKNFVDYLLKKSLNIINGRWLFKYMMIDVVDYICSKLNIKPEQQEISILMNDNSELVSESILKLAKRVKNINCVTVTNKKFKKLEENVREETGLILNITNNLKKAVLKSNIILNLDFQQEDFNKLVISKNTVVVNLEKNIELEQKNFNGINLNYIYINLPVKYQELYKKLRNFCSTNLYESFIYKRTSPENIWKEIANDKIEIISLEGKNGIINSGEFDRLKAITI